MSKLRILEYPDTRLRQVARPVAEVTERERQLADDMLETMYEANGIGLAATQVAEEVRLFVLDVSEERNAPRVFVNPEIVERSGRQTGEEGCLSAPGVIGEVERAEQIQVRATDRDGEPFELEADGLLAVCIQHELDHLDGRMFFDHLSPLKRRMIEKRLRKQRRQTQAPA